MHRHLDRCVQSGSRRETTAETAAALVSQTQTTPDTKSSSSSSNQTQSPPSRPDLSVAAKDDAVDTTPEASNADPRSSSAALTEEDHPTPTTHDLVTPDEKPPPKGDRAVPSPTLLASDVPADVPCVFARMMAAAQTTFAKPTQQTLYLDADRQVSLHTNTGGVANRVAAPAPPYAWSQVVQIKERRMDDTSAAAAPPPVVQVTLASAIPPVADTETPHRWVVRHSRLSVPVLKSMLQKAIRRKRPLPAVRVAMELLDKAPAELLRRLPIIALEDSSLHPNLPLLVWLMMAHSKDFHIPLALGRALLQIVFEIAACPNQDALPETIGNLDDTTTNNNLLSLSTLTDITLWSLVARAAYGGMKGDVVMLQRYACLWQTRYKNEACQLASCPAMSWRAVPQLLHATAHHKATQAVPHQIPCLYLADITLEGVDFHCSNVLEHLATDQTLFDLCHDLLMLSSSTTHEIPEASERRAWILDTWRSAMWTYSAGVNRRRPLLLPATGLPPAPITHANNNNMWNELLAPKVQAFQKAYVEQRLAR